MKSTLVFPQQLLDNLLARLLADEGLETCAIFLARSAQRSDHTRFLVFEEIFVDPAKYDQRSIDRIVLSPELVHKAAVAARKQTATVVFVHSHPGLDTRPIFSKTDDQGELPLVQFFSTFLPDFPIVSVVVSSGGIRARIMESHEDVEIVSIGRSLNGYAVSSIANMELHNRQILALGKEGQERIGSLNIGIVGLGGTGSFVAQELIYLGASSFILIDPEIIEYSNLNRLVGASINDIGTPKVNVAKRTIKNVSPEANVECFQADVIDDASAEELLECSIIFCCTDSHGSRAVLNQLSYQYFIPVIDMGVSLTAKDGLLTHINGRVQLLGPGLGCLTCGEFLNPDEVRRDLMSENQKADDPYFTGAEGLPQPAVISVNGTISSLAITMFLGIVTELPIPYRYQLYDGISGRLRSVEHMPRPGCVTCSPEGAYARGDTWDLPTRK